MLVITVRTCELISIHRTEKFSPTHSKLFIMIDLLFIANSDQKSINFLLIPAMVFPTYFMSDFFFVEEFTLCGAFITEPVKQSHNDFKIFWSNMKKLNGLQFMMQLRKV